MALQKTFCRACEPSCGLVAEVENGELKSLKPDADHPVTKGFACHKGLATFDIHHDKDRLNYPQQRDAAGQLQRVSWDDAAAGVAARIAELKEEYGPDAVASYTGNPLAFNTLAGPAIGSFLLNNGIRRNFSSGTQDCMNKFAAGEAVFGSSTVHPVPDIDNTDFLLIFGSNPRVSHMSFLSIADPMEVLRNARKRGADIRFVDPRENESVKGIGSHVPIKPDTDVYLLAAMLHHIFAGNLHNEDILVEHADNVAALKTFVEAYSPAKVAAVTGLSGDEIVSLTNDFVAAERASVYMSTGVNMGRQGSLAYWLLYMLSLVTGNLDKPGGNIHSVGFYPAAKAGRRQGPVTYEDSPYGEIRRVRGSLPGALLGDMILAEENPIRGLVVISGNPLLSMGSGEKLSKAFEKLEFMVVIDIYPSATSHYADFVLPATDMYERPDINLAGLGLQRQPFIQYTSFVVPPREERRPEWWILRKIEAAQGLDADVEDLDESQETYERLLRENGLFNRINHMLTQSDLSIDEVASADNSTVVLNPLTSGSFYSNSVQTETGRIDCCPDVFEEAIQTCHNIYDELLAEPADQLKMISRRTNYMLNSWFHNVQSLKRPSQLNNPVYMHPEDARARNLGDGSEVRVSNNFGEITTEVVLDESLTRGTVAITHGWGHQQSGLSVAKQHPGTNANNLLPSGPGSYEKISNQSFMTGIPVDVEAA